MFEEFYGRDEIPDKNCLDSASAAPRILMTRRIIIGLGLGASLIIGGCGPSRPARVPVAGKVLIDGQPLRYGVVRFTPAEGRPSSGQLDENGHFVLSCFEVNDGALVGKHQIEVSGLERIKDDEVRWNAPKKYDDRSTSGLTEEIKEATDSIVIKLTWDGGKPFTEPYASTSGKGYK
jgi:hypothetical protein